MAKQPPIGAESKKGPSLGRVVMLDTFRGSPRARKWPGKRGPSKVPAQREHVKQFTRVQKTYPYIAAEEAAALMQATKGGPFYPRDIFTMAHFGTLWIIHMNDGRVLYPVQFRNDVSESLDAIANTPGSRLVRGADWWEGDTGLGSSAPQSTYIEKGPTSGSDGACKAIYFTPLMDLTVIAAWPCVEEVNTRSYRCVIARTTNLQVDAILAESPIQTATATETKNRLFTFDTPVFLSAGQQYIIGHQRTDGTASNSSGIRQGKDDNWTVPAEVQQGYARYEQNPLAVGNTPDQTNENVWYCMNLIFAI